MTRSVIVLVSSMDAGGTERVAAHLANAWASRGDSVTLVATYSGRGKCAYPLASAVRLIYLADHSGGPASRGAMSYWSRFWALRRLIREMHADAIVSFLTNVNVAAAIVTLGLQQRLFVSERSFPPARDTGRLLAVLRHVTYQRAAGVVMQTYKGMHWLNTKIPKAKGMVIPNPVIIPLPSAEPTLHPEEVVSPARRLLLSVGRLDNGKQFDHLIEAFALLASTNSSWDLVIIGEGPNAAELRRQVTRLKLGQRVIFPGRAGNIADWYRRADLFAMTSRYEGFPNTLAEAMAHGCAAVSYDCDTGPRDIIRHELDGLLVSPVGDVAGLARALDRLMKSDAERSKMGERAKEVRERYSLEKILAMWDQLFDTGSVQ